jgi:CP family cyanate transporter-like MFS transporter
MIGIVAVALNLRPAVTSLGPLLADVQRGLRLGGAASGLLTALPTLCFAAFGAIAAGRGARIGPRRITMAAMVVLAAGLAARGVAGGELVFFAASVVALGGIAVANVLVPVLVRQYFPDRIGEAMGVYSMALSAGTAVPAAITVPLAGTLGHSWRGSLEVWAGTALLAVLPWFAVRGSRRVARPRRGHQRQELPGRLRVWGSRTGLGLAVFFGMQSLSAYAIMGWLPRILRDAGVPAGASGVLLAVTTGLSVPVSLVLPRLAVRLPDQRPLVVVLVVFTLGGYVGLAVAPAAAPLLWAVLLGIGQGAFPLALTMIPLRVRTTAHTAALSGFTQAVGYLLAAAGPFVTGVLHDATGGWTVPIVVLSAFLVPQLAAGLMAARNRTVEDDLEGRSEALAVHPEHPVDAGVHGARVEAVRSDPADLRAG